MSYFHVLHWVFLSLALSLENDFPSLLAASAFMGNITVLLSNNSTVARLHNLYLPICTPGQAEKLSTGYTAPLLTCKVLLLVPSSILPLVLCCETGLHEG